MSAILAIALAVLSAAPLTREQVLDKAFTACPLNPRPNAAQRQRLRELLDIEEREGVPPFARGILLAAVCQESAYVLQPSCGDEGKSCGILQLRGEGHLRGLRALGATGRNPRTDWQRVAAYWLQHLKRQLERVKVCCWREPWNGYSSQGECLWASANKTATWCVRCKRWGGCRVCEQHAADGKCTRCAKRYCAEVAGRCSRPKPGWTTKHWTRLRVWHGRERG
jgi:hypothetical protein